MPIHVLIIFLILATAGSTYAADDPAGIEFFETKVRPVLVEHCYKCHSADSDKLKGGLLVDSKQGLLKGGDTGPAIVPGDPGKSLLIKAVRYTDDELQMPPKNKKLADAQIADLEAWVKMGAPDPRTGSTNAAAADLTKARSHWAFQPIKDPQPPTVRARGWVSNPIDAFILSKLEDIGIRPSLRADKRTLIRRATFDLTGLPPKPEDVEAFLADSSAEAFSKVIDRLLASPAYGENWGRHWLDVARYADTKGYVFEEERRYPYAYTYRDYVIRSFNEDVPYDRFILEQIAADLLPLGSDKRPLAGLGFLTLGRRFLNNEPDIIDDRIDLVTRGTMGLTVACARCHDHKYDPIPTKDYYSMYGVFSSSHEPSEKPLLGTNSLPARYPEYLKEHEKRTKALSEFRQKKEREALIKIRSEVGDYLFAVHESNKLEADKREQSIRGKKLDPTVARRWRETSSKWTADHPVFGLWVSLAGLPEKEFGEKAPAAVKAFSELTNANPIVAAAFATNSPASLKETATRFNKILADIETSWREEVSKGEKEKAPVLDKFQDPPREALRQVLYAADSPTGSFDGDLKRLFDVPTAQELRKLQRQIDELDATHEGAPPRAMALADKSNPSTARVFIRGNAGNHGPEVPRQFLEIIAGANRQPFTNGSGRLEMAKHIASKENPLTARVLVNRVWIYHFGQGLVRTPSDFGVRSDPPTHPELLDFLATEFMRQGWSIKKLHRMMMLSSTYQQVSDDNPAVAKVDPGNVLLWRMNRQRLSFEAMRDSLLAVSGKLDGQTGGHAVDIIGEPFSARRTVYGFIDRQNLPGMFRTFDFASPDATSPQRFYTTVPQQALFLMNSPFVALQARSFVDRVNAETNSNAEAKRLERLYRLAFQRPPAKEEVEMGLKFVRSIPTNSGPRDISLWQHGYGSYDAESKKTKSFTPFPFFSGSAWQGSEALPDKALGWATLNATGGHPGDDLQRGAIRRWTAPGNGVLKVRGTLSHDQTHGDGVRGWVVSSRDGLLGEWVVQNRKQEIKLNDVKVEKGDYLDFIVDLNKTISYDSFTWAPLIKVSDAGSKLAQDHGAEWNSQAEFTGPGKEKNKPLNAWEKYAQVLLLSNEFMFVD